MKLCRHCKKSPVARPKGLCWRCYYDLDIRALYPSTSRFTPGRKETYNESPPCKECGDPSGMFAYEVAGGRKPLCVVCRKPESERDEWRERFARMESLAEQELPLVGKREFCVRRVDIERYKEPIHGDGTLTSTTEFTTAGAEGYSAYNAEDAFFFGKG